MKICSNCGALLEDRAQFCTSCGTPLASAEPTETPENITEAAEANAPETVTDASVTPCDCGACTDNGFAASAHEVGSCATNAPASSPATSPVANVSFNAGVNGAPKVTRTKKQPSGIGIKLLCIFLSFVFCVLLCATSTLGIVRWSLGSEGLEDAVASVSFDEIEKLTVRSDGKEMPMAEFILDFCDDEVKDKYGLDEEKVMDVLKDTKANEFIGEIVGDYSAYLLEGEELRELNGERVTDWIRKNESKIEDIIEYEFKDEDYRDLEKQINDTAVIRSMSKESLETETGIGFNAFGRTASLIVYIAMIVLSAGVAAIIVLVNRRKVRALFTYVTVSVAVVGGFFLVLAGGVYISSGLLLPKVAASMFNVVVLSVLLRGGVMFVFGIAASVIHKLIFDSRHKA